MVSSFIFIVGLEDKHECVMIHFVFSVVLCYHTYICCVFFLIFPKSPSCELGFIVVHLFFPFLPSFFLIFFILSRKKKVSGKRILPKSFNQCCCLLLIYFHLVLVVAFIHGRYCAKSKSVCMVHSFLTLEDCLNCWRYVFCLYI